MGTFIVASVASIFALDVLAAPLATTSLSFELDFLPLRRRLQGAARHSFFFVPAVDDGGALASFGAM